MPLVRIACFGDSLTEGYGLHPEQALPAVLERLLCERGASVRCLNFGVSGDTASDGLARIRQVLDAKPDVAVLAFGANDCFMGEPVETVRSTLARIIETFLRHSVTVLLVGISATLAPDDAYRNDFDAIFASLAHQFGLDLFPDILAPYFGDPELTLLDGLHPSASGVEAMARALLPQVERLARTAAS
ncbi:arylesterase [Pseudodesulfovibrio sp. F-1]|uniref:Arylesterase n=1 Tax=Pseudodesulfovibrio alkaliphilus TaxID=2661613 RepID=A0A7K1KLP4_9BACT|nr:arylesterase [Pseudodesulfovibrio alkaliphilus]MUM76985.1 arylesterase [Pseudodesulfovibrio alkaliphilus]